MKFNKRLLAATILSSLFSPCLFSQDNTKELIDTESNNVVIVTAEMDDSNVLKLSNSVTVVNSETINARSAQHLSDIFNIAPNVNFSTGASRGRFIQIRGIGERSEFSEPVNYSVGVVLDGIDLTGISTAATTLDLQQVEILRGPQSTLYGANGLAGLINLVSNDPTDYYYAKLSTTIEEYGGLELSGVVSGPISDTTGYRFAVKKFQSDGFIDNKYLNRSDTNNIDELSLRGKITSLLNKDLQLTSTVFFTEIDNGYDAFSLDSNRTTLSDQPGFDRQKTNAIAFNLDWDINHQYWLESTISYSQSDLDYAYDVDWTHTGICDSLSCDSSLFGDDWWYSYFDQYTRKNDNTSLDIKLHSNHSKNALGWVMGIYFNDQNIDLTRQYTELNEDFLNQHRNQTAAIYGQTKIPLAEKFTLVSGLRFESAKSDYSDSNDVTFSPEENLWGGKIAIEYQYSNSNMIYALISKGFKKGGFNTNGTLSEKNRIFDTEFQWNYETGIKGKWLNNTLTLQAAVFYQDRKNIQTKQSIVQSIDSGMLIQEGGICPCSFTDFTDNGPKGTSSGIEIESTWQTTDNLQLYATLGILDAKFTDFSSYTHVDADQDAIPPVPVDLSGRSVAHAPNYQFVLGGIYYLTNKLSINPEIESKDSFYFSDRHNDKSDAYNLINIRLVYQELDWRVSLYANNLTNEEIQTRGFAFANDPRDFYESSGYSQLAAPRVIGLSFTKEFD